MASVSPLYLRDDELTRALHLFWLAELELVRPSLRRLVERDLMLKDYLILLFVAACPDTTVAALTQLLGSSKQALSRHVIRLRAAGLLTEGEPSRDRRRRPLRITPAGEELLGELVTLQKRVLRRGFGQAGPEAVAGFLTVLARLLSDRGRPFLPAAGRGSGET